MQDWILDILNTYGYLGIGLLIALENLFPPIPSEVILTFAGFLSTQSEMNVWGVCAASVVGSLAGALILYFLGRILTPLRLEWILERYGRVLRLDKNDLKRAEGWFHRHGNAAVFFCRFIPIIRSLISIPAGTARMPLPAFLTFTLLGTTLWNTALVHFGALAGANWEHIVEYLHTYSVAVAILLLVGGVLFLFLRFGRPGKNPQKKD